MAEEHSIESFLLGALIGGILGAGTALLLAPASGKETRALLANRAKELAVEGEKEADVIKEFIREELIRLAESKDAFAEAFKSGVKTYKTQTGASGAADEG